MFSRKRPTPAPDEPAGPRPWVDRPSAAPRDALAERRSAGSVMPAAAVDPLAARRLQSANAISSPSSGVAVLPGPSVTVASAPSVGRHRAATRPVVSDAQTPPSSPAPLRGRGRRHARSTSVMLATALCGGVAGAGVALWAAPDPAAVTAAPASGGGGAAAIVPQPATAAEAAAAKILPSVVQVRAGSGSGSGFVLDDQGHVMTNHHVIEGSSRVRLVLADGSAVSAEVVGSDAARDIAVLRADDAGSLPAVAIGRSSELTIGESVLAVGSPLGLTGTVTGGLVSAVDREARLGSSGSQRVVQTDAPINPGSSGGPLVTLDGEVVGVNTAIATLSRGSGSIGIGFAVPIDEAMAVADRILAGG